MKTCISVLSLILVLAAGSALATAEEGKAARGENVTISGTMTCSFCKLAHTDTPCHHACCEKCVGAGESPLLTDADGNMYLLLTGEKGAALMNKDRLAWLGGKVTVTGVLVKGKGVQAIFVDRMQQWQEAHK